MGADAIGPAYILSCIVVGLIAGRVWESKGGQFRFGFWLGALMSLLGLFYVAFAQPERSLDEPKVGDTVELTKPLKLDVGGRLPRGYAAAVLATDVIQGHDVVRIQGPRDVHYVAKDGVRVIKTGAPRERKCPRCAELVKAEAKVCRFCSHEFVQD